MKSVLILYPKLFNCYSKFSRKVEKIISSLGEVTLLFPCDPNLLIQRFHDENLESTNIEHMKNWTKNDITHAIIFDDGEEFSEESNSLKLHNIPLRIITIKITRVVNIKKEEQYQSMKSNPEYEYIGRGSRWGNPYSIFEIEELEEGEDPRDLVVSNFKYDFDNDKLFNLKKEEVFSLAGKRLGCFCKPLPCHGDILADFLNEWDDGK